jgi:hypothetical protein
LSGAANLQREVGGLTLIDRNLNTLSLGRAESGGGDGNSVTAGRQIAQPVFTCAGGFRGGFDTRRVILGGDSGIGDDSAACVKNRAG